VVSRCEGSYVDTSSASAATSMPLLRRHLADKIGRQVPGRACPLWDNPPPPEQGVPPCAADVDALCRADPGFSTAKRHVEEVFVDTPLDLQAFARSHFEHCPRCLPRVGMLEGLPSNREQWLRGVFECFDPPGD